MKSNFNIRTFLLLAGSSLFAISNSRGQTILANSYDTSLDVSSDTTLYSSLNFPSYIDGSITGSATLTTTGYFGSLLYLTNNGGNTFTGDIIVDSGTLRVGPSPFLTTTGGFTAPGLTSSNTITINRAGTLVIDDNSTTGYTANRFGTDGNRPNINLAGGRLDLNGLNNASSSIQTFGALTASSGQAIISVTRNSTGNPTLNFDSLSISKGAVVNFYSAALGTGTNDARITFDTAPTLTNGILKGAKYWSPGAAGQGEFATYDTNGVRAFTSSDYTIYNTMDINAATSTQNVQMTGAFAPVALSGDTTINSLNYNGSASSAWDLGGNKLTLLSGMFLRNGANNALTIQNGTLTAGNATDDIDLHFFTAQNSVTVNAVIADNASSAVTLVKSHGNSLTLGADNTYTGGTYVVDGQINTGNVANRRYLGTGVVTVNNALLSLGNIGATSNATGDDYTAINSAQINIASGANGAYTANDTFNIGAGSIISSNGSASGQGLASLTRGTNITLAENAVIGHGQQTAALNLSTATIQNLGTSSEFYYGLANTNQNNSGGSIEIGSGTAFKGISTDRTSRAWQQGIINITSGTTSVNFQGFQTASAAPAVLTLGNGGTAGAPVINFAGTGTVDIRALGSLVLNDSTATYGNTGSSQNVRFVSTSGSTLTVTPATGMGSGTGIASALVQNGGLLVIGNSAALNGAVTVQGGGQFNANQAGGLTGGGALTFNEGSIINITSALGFSGTQATGASLAAGTIVRLGVNNYGAAGTTLDSIVGGNSPIYQLSGNNGAANPTSAGTTVMTLNKNGSGVGGILTNDLSGRNLNNTTNGVLTLGANGGVIAATSGTTLGVAEDITGSGSLTIGSTSAIGGAPKAGTVTLSNASNNYSGGTIINPGFLSISSDAHLGNAAGSITLNGGGLLVGTSMTSNRELILNNAAGNLVRIQGNATWIHTGNITGDGGVTFRQNPNGGVTADLRGTANTFKGSLGINFGNSGTTVKIRSMADSVTANGNIVYGIGSSANTGGSGQIFEWASDAGSALTLDNRSVEFGQNGNAWGTIKNSHATNAITINTDLVVSGTGAKTLVLESVAGPTNVFSGDISDGSGTVSLIKAGVGSWTLSGENTHTGSTSNSAGILILDNALALQNSVLDTAASTGGSGTAGLRTTQTALTLGGLTGNKNFAATGGVFSTTAGGYNSVTALTLNPGSGVTRSYAGVIANGAADMTLTKTGAGTQILTATNTYTGATNVNGGTLQLDGSTHASSTMNIGTAGTLTGTGTVNGNATLTGNGIINKASGTIAGTLAVTGGNWNGAGVVTGLVTSSSGAFTIANGANLTASSGVSVSGGSVVVNGTLSGTLSAAAGSTVYGSGTVTGLATISGNLNPGNSPGTLTFDDALTLQSTTVTTMEIDGLARGTEYDAIDVGGDFTYAGSLVLDFGVAFVNADTYSFNLFDFANPVDSFDSVTLAGVYTGSFVNNLGVWTHSAGNNTWTFTQSDGVLEMVVVPEPKAALLGALGVLLLLRRRR